MWSLVLDALARLVRADRRTSQVRRLSLVDAFLAEASAHGTRGAFVVEPWRFGVPETVIVQLARRRGYRLQGATGDWTAREPFTFVAAGRDPAAGGGTADVEAVGATGARGMRGAAAR